MSFINSISFEVLSSASSEADIFNRLVKVKRLDTGEEGTLLCSHCCKWPADLKDQATWLEGCFTPKDMEKDSRLLMGYHPKHLVSWSYDQDTKIVELKLYLSGSEEDDGIYFPLPYNPLSAKSRLYRWIDRVFSSCLEEDDWQSARSVFSLAVRLMEQKRIDYAVLLGLGYWLQQKIESNLHCSEGEWLLDLIPFEEGELGEYFFPLYIDSEGYVNYWQQNELPVINGVVIHDRLYDFGFARAWSIPYTRTESALIVDKLEEGFHPASELIYHLEEGLLFVLTQELDWYPAVPIDRNTKPIYIGNILYKPHIWEDYSEESLFWIMMYEKL